MRVYKGRFTIEAAVWVPVFLLVVFLALQTGLTLYQEIRETDFCEKTKKLDIVQEFYNYQILNEVIQEVDNDQS